MRKIYNLFWVLLLVSCSSIESILTDDDILYLSGYENVKIVPQDTKSTGLNIHPIKVPSQKIEGGLRLLLVKFGRKTIPLFPDEKLEVICESIEKAFLRVQKDEDIVFTIESWYTSDSRFKDNRVVSGRIFYNKDGLNVIFGSILRKGAQSTTDPMLVSRNPDLRKNPYVPGSRLLSVRNPYPLAAPPASGVLRPQAAKGRKDWIVLTSKSLMRRPNLTEQQKQSAYSSNIEVQDLRNELQSLRQELRMMKQPNQARYYNPYNNYQNRQPYNGNQQNYRYNGYPNQPYQNPYYPNTGNINNQQNTSITLKSLENMRSRGLISEENYLKKLKELGF
tara:strand:- start:1537 stop:2541 length:1005 start_codon:yes stop_codon:yes gene_type:complete